MRSRRASKFNVYVVINANKRLRLVLIVLNSEAHFHHDESYEEYPGQSKRYEDDWSGPLSKCKGGVSYRPQFGIVGIEWDLPVPRYCSVKSRK